LNIGILPLISSVVSFIFAITVLDQYFARRKPYQLVWSIGLFMYCISTFIEFWTETFGMNYATYQLWYLFGAIYVAAYLGMGTLYLLLKRRLAHIVMIILGVASIYGAIVVFTASIDLKTISTLSGGVMPSGIRILTAFFNVFGTIALVGGALYSACIFGRRRILLNRMISNILIALGAMLPAVGGTAFTFGGPRVPYYTLELGGIIIIFIGFLRTKEVFGFFRFPLIHGFSPVNEADISFSEKRRV
jgi:hypothetical protein